LKVERVSARVKQYRLAEAMGVSTSRVSAIEREEYPSPEIVARYRAAIAQRSECGVLDGLCEDPAKHPGHGDAA
jgi:transcriptional regulator with XRE-family HTH domain